MVRITAESDGKARRIEGKAAIVYVMDPTEGGDHAVCSILAARVKRLDFLTGVMFAMGNLVAELYDNPFERTAVLSLLAKELMEARENTIVAQREGTVRKVDDED